MSFLKISPNLFLGEGELNNLISFLFDSHLFSLVDSFGIVKVGEEDTTSFTLSNNSLGVTVKGNSIAINSFFNIIYLEDDEDIEIPQTGDWYFLKISHESHNLENGTISVDSTGRVVGTGVDFTGLRGQPNFPSRIALIHPTTEVVIDEFEVLSVIDDTNLVLNGDFSDNNFPEGMKYSVVGTFAPDYSPPEDEKYIYNYDKCKITVVHSPTGVIPSLSTGEYFIGKVYYDTSEGFYSSTDLRTSFFALKYIHGIDTKNVVFKNLVAEIVAKYTFSETVAINKFMEFTSSDQISITSFAGELICFIPEDYEGGILNLRPTTTYKVLNKILFEDENYTNGTVFYLRVDPERDITITSATTGTGTIRLNNLSKENLIDDETISFTVKKGSILKFMVLEEQMVILNDPPVVEGINSWTQLPLTDASGNILNTENLLYYKMVGETMHFYLAEMVTDYGFVLNLPYRPPFNVEHKFERSGTYIFFKALAAGNIVLNITRSGTGTQFYKQLQIQR